MKNRKGTHMRAARICSSESSPNFCWFINYFGVPHGVTRKQVMNLFIYFVITINNYQTIFFFFEISSIKTHK